MLCFIYNYRKMIGQSYWGFQHSYVLENQKGIIFLYFRSFWMWIRWITNRNRVDRFYRYVGMYVLLWIFSNFIGHRYEGTLCTLSSQSPIYAVANLEKSTTWPKVFDRNDRVLDQICEIARPKLWKQYKMK